MLLRLGGEGVQWVCECGGEDEVVGLGDDMSNFIHHDMATDLDLYI